MKHVLERKLAILGQNIFNSTSLTSAKTLEDRKLWWSKMMESAIKDSDRLKASELLGRAEADFIDTTKHVGADGGPIEIIPMNLSGLQYAIKQVRQLEDKSEVR